GILWHQLYDFEADQKTGVQTFVVRYSRRPAVSLARTALLIEVTGLAVVLGESRTAWPLVFLLVYAVFAALKARLWDCSIVIAEPCERYAILGQEYYTLLFPVALLLSSGLQNPANWIVLIVQLVVFPQPAVSFVREICLFAQFLPAIGGSPSGAKTKI